MTRIGEGEVQNDRVHFLLAQNNHRTLDCVGLERCESLTTEERREALLNCRVVFNNEDTEAPAPRPWIVCEFPPTLRQSA